MEEAASVSQSRQNGLSSRAHGRLCLPALYTALCETIVAGFVSVFREPGYYVLEPGAETRAPSRCDC